MKTLDILKFVHKRLAETNELLEVMKECGSPKARRQVVACRRCSILFSDLGAMILKEDRDAEDREGSTSA